MPEALQYSCRFKPRIVQDGDYNHHDRTGTLEAELLAMRVERANNLADVRRVLEWFDDPRRKPAVNAFPPMQSERQLAYRFESMLQGEFICTKCGLRKNSETPPASF